MRTVFFSLLLFSYLSVQAQEGSYHKDSLYDILPDVKVPMKDGAADNIFQRWLQHNDYDSFWSAMIPYIPEEYAHIDIPILTVTGYFDADQRGALYYYNMHNRYGPAAAVKNHYLLIGPWDHAGAQSYPQRKTGSYTVNSAALAPVLPIVMDWFDYILLGKAKPSLLKDRVNYFVMDGTWKHSPSLSAMNTDTLQYFLQRGMDNWHHLTGQRYAHRGPVHQHEQARSRSVHWSI